MEKSKRNAFSNTLVTVGTTEFEELIRSCDTDEFYQTLHSLGCTHLTLQIGTGTYIPLANRHSLDKENLPFSVEPFNGLKIIV